MSHPPRIREASKFGLDENIVGSHVPSTVWSPRQESKMLLIALRLLLPLIVATSHIASINR